MLGMKIKEYLHKNGIKISFVAEKAEIALPTFSAMLNGKRKIMAEEYFSICEVLNVSLDFFRDKKTA